MSFFRSITKREIDSRITQDYDIALLRLKCFNEDVYKGISPNVNAPDFNPTPPIFACRFSCTVGYQEVIALANEDGKIALQDIQSKKPNSIPLEGTQAHDDAIFDISWMPQEMKLVTASGDHLACLWDVSLSRITKLQTFQAHTRSIKNAVFRYQDKAVFATGARDGAIMIWDIRANHSNQPKPDNCIFHAHHIHFSQGKIKHKRIPTAKQTQAQSITGLVFQDDYTLLSCSTGDGLIKVWDLRKNYTCHKKDPLARHILNYGGKSNNNGFSSLLICPARLTLYANCMDNIIYAYNISTYDPKPTAEYYGHKNSTFYVKSCISPDGKYLASGSSDELAYIWNTKKPGAPLLKLNGHREEVTCIAWCSIGESKIVTCSDDSCHRIWRVGNEHIDQDEQINIHGFAEAIPSQSINSIKLSTLESTPTISNSQSASDYFSESDFTPINTPNVNDYHNNGSAKRSHSQMSTSYWLDDSKSVLSPIRESTDTSVKKLHLENRGARRLFSPRNTIELRSISSDEEEGVKLKNSYKCTNLSANITNKPCYFSPTSNLPNFVIDGTAPHLLKRSPQKSKENIDWLTKMRKEKYNASVEKLSNPKMINPVRRNSRSKSSEPRTKIANKPLLQFFRPTIKDYEHLQQNNIHNEPCSSKHIMKN